MREARIVALAVLLLALILASLLLLLLRSDSVLVSPHRNHPRPVTGSRLPLRAGVSG